MNSTRSRFFFHAASPFIISDEIDDHNAGWKGRGLWMTYSSYLPRFTENRSGTVNHMQIRLNPLANYAGRNDGAV